MTLIDQYAVSTVPIEMYFNETFLSVGTGFIWKSNDRFFLITNWHNVSGKDPNTGKHLSKTLAEPNKLKIWWNLKYSLGNKVPHEHSVRGPNDEPLWWVHPKHKRNIDVVAIAIEPPAFAEPYPISEMTHDDGLLLAVGMDVFVLGYPYGIGQGGFPIWKRASIATEPNIAALSEEKYILLDTASRPGMSGAPVIRRTWGATPMIDGSVAMFTGSATKFVGVYSGRLVAKDPLDAQLGIAWPSDLVSQIVEGRCLDNPF